MSVLDGFRELFGEVFEDFMFPGTLHKVVLTDDGKGGLSSAPANHPVFLLIEEQGEEWRQEDNYSDQDSVILILQHQLGSVTVDADDKVTSIVEGVTQKWQLKAPIKQDPVRASYQARGSEING